MNKKVFNELGDVVPAAFGLDVPPWTVRARLDGATSIARQLRCRHELLLSERTEGADLADPTMLFGKERVTPLGDRVLREAPEKVLELLAHHLLEYDNLSRRVGEKNSRELRAGEQGLQGLRSLYGYSPGEWSVRPAAGMSPRRVVVRIGVCLAADATFTPYARGLLDAIATCQASLRIDLRSAANAIWVWATDYPALARSLSVARTGLDGETAMAFPSFTRLLRRVLSDHLESAIDEDARPDEIDAAAEACGQVATRGLADVVTPGRTYEGNIYKPMVALLAEAHSDWLPEEREEDAEEEFARGAAPLVLAGLLRQRHPEAIADDLESLARALRAAKVVESDDA